MVTSSTSSDSIAKDASSYTNAYLDTTGKNGGAYYRREATNQLLADMDSAVDLGDLVFDKTQLNVTAQVSQANPENYYKFELDGDSIKLSHLNYTATSELRVQIMDSSGKVVIDNSETASETLQSAYEDAYSPDGFDLDAGTYYAKVSFNLTEKKSIAQSYELSLYSGNVFKETYSTIAASQIKSTQHVSIDNTMVFSTLDALSYSTKDTHRANSSADDPINVGWLYENKTALSVQSMLTNISDEHFYTVTLQKGDALKFAIDEKTKADMVRVQLMDPSGTYVYADSHGTDAQKEAYANLTSENGLESKRGQYLIKTSFIQGKDKTTDMEYTFKIYAGDHYDSLYKTIATTETMDTALLQGSLTAEYNPITSLASYLQAQAAGTGTNIMETLKSRFS